MAVSGDSWMQEYDEASKLAKEIAGMASQSSTQSCFFALKTKILVFGTKLDTLEFHLSNHPHPHPHPLKEEEMNHRKEMVADLRSKMYEMPLALTFNAAVSTSATRNSLLDVEPGIEQANAMSSRADGLIDNSQILHLQRQTIRAQDEELDTLIETIRSSNQIAWAINEELRLHERLSVDANKYVEVPDSRLQRFAMMNRRTSRGGSCLWFLLLSLSGVLVLPALIYMLIKYLRSSKDPSTLTFI